MEKGAPVRTGHTLPSPEFAGALHFQIIMLTRRQFVAVTAAAALVRPTVAQTPPIAFIDSHVHVWKHDPAFPFAAGAHPTQIGRASCRERV